MKKALLFLAIAVSVACNQNNLPKCDPGPDEKCPASKDYERIKAFQQKYKPPDEEMDAVNGTIVRLQSNPPVGFHWDGNKLLYVKNPPPVPPATPPSTPPVPTPAK